MPTRAGLNTTLRNAAPVLQPSYWRRRALLRQGETFHNVTVVPYQQLLNRPGGGHDHQGGPLWPAWEQQRGARFNRDSQPCDLKPDFQEPRQTLTGEQFVWVGPIHPHFGHSMAEFLTRLACSTRSLENPTLVFSSRSSHPVASLDDAPAWLSQVLAWYGAEDMATVFVTEPTRFESLTVFPQPEQLHQVPPSRAYLELLDEITASNLGEQSTGPDHNSDSGKLVYVSRAGVMTGFAGEEYLETVLEQIGIRPFRPEQHSIAQQMSVYRNAQHLVFAEGSALHGAQLLGRALNKVSVLTRRSGAGTGPFCEAFIKPRARSLDYVDITRGMIHGENALGKPAYAAGLPLLDADKLMHWLDRQGLPIGSLWDAKAFHHSEEKSVEKWLTFNTRRKHSEASKTRIRKNLETFGFAALAARAPLLKPNQGDQE